MRRRGSCRGHIASAILVAATIVATAGLALAQSSAALAEALFAEGRQALKDGDYDKACSKLTESQRIDPQTGTRLNIAICEEKRGRLATAWAHYQAVRDELPKDDDRRPIAVDALAALEPRLPRLTLALAPGAPRDTLVTIGGVPIRSAGFAVSLPIDPGLVELDVTAPGHGSNKIRITVGEGAHERVEVAPGAPIAKASHVALRNEPHAPDVTAPPSGPSAQTIAGWTLLGVGAVAIVGGVGTGIAGLVKRGEGKDHCSDELMACDQEGVDANSKAKRLLTATTITWISGAVLAGLGITLALTGDDAPAQGALAPMLVRGGGGALLYGRF